MQKPLVSIIMPSFNCADYIELSVRSVLSQKYSNYELIIVDDASDSSHVEVLKQISTLDQRIKIVFLTKNAGAAVARNVGIGEATGRYIAFLDSDDIWLPEKLEVQIRFMLDNNVAFSYAAYQKVDQHGAQLGSVGVPDKVAYTDLLKVSSIGCLTAVYDTQKLGKIYMPLIRKRQDLGLWLRILRSIPYAYGIMEPLAQYRVRSDSLSSNKRIAAQYTWRLYRDVEQLGFFQSVYFFTHYAVNGFLRTKLPSLARALGVLK
ncbi:MAG: glycosyltransferase [Pseudomonadota bacterium]|nr:glycosyltransferase [Pseudomonadota bacterium]